MAGGDAEAAIGRMRGAGPRCGGSPAVDRIAGAADMEFAQALLEGEPEAVRSPTSCCIFRPVAIQFASIVPVAPLAKRRRGAADIVVRRAAAAPAVGPVGMTVAQSPSTWEIGPRRTSAVASAWLPRSASTPPPTGRCGS